ERCRHAALHARHVDDHARGAALAPTGHDALDHAYRADDVGLHDSPELVDWVVLHRAAADDRGVVHHRVEVAGGGEAGAHGRVVGDVERVHAAAFEVGEE